jgi:4-amino-4-deoxy-L-arabinose transferase-like glycosyltransferase
VANLTATASRGSRRLIAWYGLAAILAVFTYFYGLDSHHIPKNGDEYPYEHITRLTAARGHWLPLQSEIPEMRNTKPPLLFWQGMVSTNWGHDWTLWDLRWPSAVYTMLTAGLALLVAWKLSGQLETGLVALLTFLAFFSTYRYGRPFLTDSPSTFWLFVPCCAVLWQPAIIDSRLAAPLLLGIATGIGLLYKSFALVVPVGLFFGWWYLRHRHYVVRTFLARDAGKVVILGGVALAVFSLWFLFDPDPRAIVNEFVLRENAGKFGAPGDYVKNFVWGGSSIWRLLVSYPVNAGLLMFPVIAMFVVTFKRRTELSEGETLLWMWVATLLVVFSLPSQRDERYLLPAMPALAVLCALNWERIGDGAFKASLVATGVALGLLAYLSVRLEQGVLEGGLYPVGYWALVILAIIVVIVSVAGPKLARLCVNVAILLALLTFAAFLRPFDGSAGIYDARAQLVTNGRTVWVPVNFAAKEEGYRFLLPGADVRPYPLDAKPNLAELLAQGDLVTIRLPITGPRLSAGVVLGERLDIGTRHTPEQILDMLRGHVFEHLFVRELLVEEAGIVQ